ncbi:MAG TPA: redoxin family protein [Ottowia sp.]|uniref:redoxin family protein n=1 Tax=Ottowia sp. TaxID=1898956 RepID=UPI002BE98774|nr:redoxin family protein [Ottowia sp.]HMN20115.1 redoxin family protein [Ottowia sp.]
MQPTHLPASRLRRWRRHGATLAWLLLALLGVHAWQTRHVPSGPAPDFRASAVAAQAGATMSLTQWRAAHPGQPVALNFWAEWCPVCKLEQDNVSRVANHWPVLTVALRSGDAATVQRELARRSLHWAAVTDPQGEIAAAYGVTAVPAFIVLDADGRIRASSVGYTTTAGLWLRLAWAGWR